MLIVIVFILLFRPLQQQRRQWGVWECRRGFIGRGGVGEVHGGVSGSSILGVTNKGGIERYLKKLLSLSLSLMSYPVLKDCPSLMYIWRRKIGGFQQGGDDGSNHKSLACKSTNIRPAGWKVIDKKYAVGTVQKCVLSTHINKYI